jgi:hypothetical protein
MPPTCKLCQAFAASRFPTAAERELPGSDTFTRDADLCDACLSQDYARGARFGVVEAFSVLAGSLAALIVAGVLTALGFAPIASSRAVSFVVLAAAGAVVLALAIRAAIPLIVRVQVGSARQDRAEQAADAERFYWLAVWASLTGRERCKRRMLKRAQAMGFRDRGRLSDRRLGGAV